MCVISQKIFLFGAFRFLLSTQQEGFRYPAPCFSVGENHVAALCFGSYRIETYRNYDSLHSSNGAGDKYILSPSSGGVWVCVHRPVVNDGGVLPRRNTPLSRPTIHNLDAGSDTQDTNTMSSAAAGSRQQNAGSTEQWERKRSAAHKVHKRTLCRCGGGGGEVLQSDAAEDGHEKLPDEAA